jgi:hypothetical protein
MKYGRRDATHADRVADYRALGCSFADTADMGMGLPDGFAGCTGVTDPVEFKSEGGQLKPRQRTFMDSWRGSAPRIVITQEDVIQHVHDMRRRARLTTRS